MIFPFSDQNPTLPCKVHLFQKWSFYRAKFYFPKVGTLPDKVTFGSPFEQSPIGPEDFWTGLQLF